MKEQKKEVSDFWVDVNKILKGIPLNRSQVATLTDKVEAVAKKHFEVKDEEPDDEDVEE